MMKIFTRTVNVSPFAMVRLFLFIALLAYSANAWATIRYVKENQTGTGDGSNWDNASSNLQAIIDASASGDEVWVAKGTYQPDSAQSFIMKEGVKIYGGFKDDETSLVDRDLTLTANASILKGNGSHVVNNHLNNLTAAAVLDGFTITDGANSGIHNMLASPTISNCTITNNTAAKGGGMYNTNGSAPTLTNCIFTTNKATDKGGGIFNTAGASPTLTNCSFTANEAANDGGGMNNEGPSPTLTNCSFTNNKAYNGAGMHNSILSQAKLINCSFITNRASGHGGGIYNQSSPITLTNCSFTGNAAGYGGGVYNFSAAPKIISCSFTANEASRGGGIYNESSSSAVITNCLIKNNIAQDGGAGVGNSSSSPTLTNCSITNNVGSGIDNRISSSPKIRTTIVYGNTTGGILNDNSTPTIQYSLVQGITDTNYDNISGDTDPLFVDPENGDYRLQPCSPVINQGYNSYYSTGQTPLLTAITTDMDGQARFYGTVDMGAYEYQGDPVPFTGIFYVKAGATGTGASWECATGDLQAAINAAQNGDEVWVAKGTYQRANSGEYFSMKEGVKIYGGFKGDETSLSARNLTLTANASILKGNGNTVIYNHSNHLTYASVLDGFTVTGGNLSHGVGGGISCWLGSPIIRNCSITGNRGIEAGGLYNQSNPSLPPVLLINCSITNNSTYYSLSGGSAIKNNYNSSITLINCTISGNTGGEGGIYNNYKLKFYNCIVYGNSGGLVDALNFDNDIQFSLVQGLAYSDNGNIPGDTDPLFVDPENGDFRLQPCSPVINKGSNTLYPSEPTTDLAGTPRFYNNGTVDMGAYEYNRQLPTTNTIHVDASVTTPGNGDSWTAAISSLAEAIQLAHQNCISIDKILVAEGTYYPEYKAGDGTTDRHKAFTITRKDLELLGGYPAGGNGARDPDAHPTILSGDLGVLNDSTDNAYHVLITVGQTIDASLKIDGFTIRDGNADGASGDRITVSDYDAILSTRSGGWYNVYGSPQLNKMKIINNRSTSLGGGVLNEGGSPTVTNTTISSNSAQAGAGWYNNNGHPILKNVVIQRNSASTRGGGWHNNEGEPNVQNLLITGNTAGVGGAAWYNSFGTSSLVNCTIAGNSGGGTSIQQALNSNTMHIRNSIVWGPNERDFSDYSSDISYTNTILRGSGGSANWNTSTGQNGNGNKDSDPLFRDPTAGDYRLQPCSPAINAGNTTFITDQSIPDLNGNTRIIGAKVDMGAYEFHQFTTEPVAGVIYVRADSTGTGTSWDCPTGDLQAAIDAASSGQEVWVAGGTYTRLPYGPFIMKEGVKIYGGFKGDETNLAQRDWTIINNASILRRNDGNEIIYNINNGLTPAAVLDGFTITGTYQRGGIINGSVSPTFRNCIITGNSTLSALGGGMYNESSSPVLINCVINNNSAVMGLGGGMFNRDSSPVLINCTISGNTADLNGGGIYNMEGSTPILRNTIIYGNNSGINDSDIDIQNSLVQGVTNTDNGNISGDTDPLFVDRANGDYRLQPCSPVMNKGSNAFYSSAEFPYLANVTTDLVSEPRFYANGIVDMGAYEYGGDASVPTLAGDNAEFTQTISGSTLIGVNGSACTVIARLSPNGAEALAGDVTAKVWVETTQPVQFVKRHYQLTPATKPGIATAKVTLYFTQQEFTDFNAANSVKLPINPTDSENYKTNLRIEKRAGSSDDDSGLPGSYDGAVVTINPLDPTVNGSITWNTQASRWEVSFDVTGFSGFFAKTMEAALPLNLISFTGTKENGVNVLNWKTTSEINTSNFEVQSSPDAKTFAKIGTVPANGSGNHQYSYQDSKLYSGTSYYRLKMNDRDGTFAYSKIISLMNDAVNKVTIHPNPAVEAITLTIAPTLLQSTATLYDVTGRPLQTITLTTNKLQVDVKSLSSGVYLLKFADGSTERFVKE